MCLTLLSKGLIYVSITIVSIPSVVTLSISSQPADVTLSELYKWKASTFSTERWSALQTATSLSLRCKPEELGVLHNIKAQIGSPEPRKKRRRTTGKRANPVALELLCRTYREFICEEVAPEIATIFESTSVGGARCTGVAFQANPSLRVVTPSIYAAGRRHRDSDYGHQPAQINYWLPLSRACGSNTLHVEGLKKNDMTMVTPLEGDFGMMHRFHGNDLFHFTLPNDTEHTRVSLDFRVVPGPLYDNDYPSSRNELNGKQAFFLGGYYAWADCSDDGVWTVREDGAGVIRGNQARQEQKDKNHC